MTAKNSKPASKAPANDDHLLKTKIVDSSPAILAALEKPLGTSTRPYPMWAPQRIHYDNGQSSLELVLSVMADDNNPMKVYSERPYEEVVALAICDMPVPSMLQLFKEGLERRAPESKNRTQFLIGDPGAGKSFMGAMQGRLRSNGPIEVFDCGGKNMNDLLFEMVLDFGAGDALAVAIDKRLQAGSLQGPSLGLLKDLPSAAISVDSEGNVKSVDWNYFKGSASSEQAHAAHDIITKVIEQEGLNKGGNALGMNSQYGPLVKAFIEGREIVLDEYNKSKEGSDNALQTVWTFLNGNINSCTVENPLKNKDQAAGPSSFTFRREDMQQGFFVTLTGNKTEDGLTTRSLNKSVYSRLSPKTLPDPTKADWGHRISQMMTGVPVLTVYNAMKEQADADPKAFGEFLMEQRKIKARIEGVPVPELQETLLQNWKNVVNASKKLADFYSEWSDMTNAEKLLTTGNTDLIEEVDEEYSKKEGIDFRKIIEHLEGAIPIRPQMLPADSPVVIDFKNFNKQPVLTEKEHESLSVSFGTRLVDFLDGVVYEKSEAVGKHRLYEKLQTVMEASGLREVKLAEGARSGQKSVEEDLNVTIFDSSDLGKQAVAARKVFCDYLRQMDKRIVETDDDKIITLDRLKRALTAVSEKNTAETKELFVVNRDHETLGSFPLAGAEIKDTIIYSAKNEELDFTLDDLVSHEDFMASLALPTVSAKNLSAIWETNTSKRMEEVCIKPDQQNQSVDDEAIEMAENRSSLGLAVTTLSVLSADAKGEERSVSVHVVLNSTRDKALVVGEKVPQKLLAAFKEAGIIHVDRHSPNAKARVEAALGDLTRGMQAPVNDILVDAFKYRNDFELDTFLLDRKIVTPQQLESAKVDWRQAQQKGSDKDISLQDVMIQKGLIKAAQVQLPVLLVDDKIETYNTKYLVKNSKKPSI